MARWGKPCLENWPTQTSIWSVTPVITQFRSWQRWLLSWIEPERIAVADHLKDKLETLGPIFIQHGYAPHEIDWMLQRVGGRVPAQYNEGDSKRPIDDVAVVPFCGPILNQLSCVLKYRNIKTATCPPPKMNHLIHSVKDLQARVSISSPACAGYFLWGKQGGKQLLKRRNISDTTLGTQKLAEALVSWETGHSMCFVQITLLHWSSN